jgi:hypothetical protein
MTYGSETRTMITEETKALRMLERKLVRKIDEPVKEKERSRKRTKR